MSGSSSSSATSCFVDWALTTPLLLLDMANLAGASRSLTAMAIIFDELMIILGLASVLSIGDSGTKWGWFALGNAAFLPSSICMHPRTAHRSTETAAVQPKNSVATPPSPTLRTTSQLADTVDKSTDTGGAQPLLDVFLAAIRETNTAEVEQHAASTHRGSQQPVPHNLRRFSSYRGSPPLLSTIWLSHCRSRNCTTRLTTLPIIRLHLFSSFTQATRLACARITAAIHGTVVRHCAVCCGSSATRNTHSTTTPHHPSAHYRSRDYRLDGRNRNSTRTRTRAFGIMTVMVTGHSGRM